jgi:hypothetical protein
MHWQVGEWLLTLLAAAFLFLLPGWALLRLWPGAARLSRTEQVALGIGIGFALYPVLLLWTDLLGLHPGALYAWLPPLAALSLLIRLRLRRRLAPFLQQQPAQILQRATWSGIALCSVLIALISIRFVAIADLHVPLWGDSLHHTMIARLLIEQGGLFHTWQPYAAMQSFTYHFGFHSHVAVLSWMTGQAPIHAVLLHGQLANSAAVITLYPLALRLHRSRWAGVITLLIAGLLVSMPMFYTNWGRYTQLAGQAILPVAIYLAWEFLTTRDRSWSLLGITALTLAGLVLTHYRVAVFAACFFPASALLIGSNLPWRAWIGRGMLLASATGLLVILWFVRVLSGKLPVILGAITAQSTAGGASAAHTETLNAVGTLSTFLPESIWYTLLISVGWALWQRNRSALLVVLWWLLAALLANPNLLGLPGAGLITNFALLLAAYIPASILVGAAAGWLLQHLPAPGTRIIATLGIIVLACWGMTMRLNDITPTRYTFVTPADLHAAAWIETHTAPDAHFLINGFFPNEAAVVGSDAGWWLPILARRQVTVPPLLYIAEQGPRPDYRQWVNQLYAILYERGLEHPETLELLRERGITHVYIGQQQGTVGNSQAAQRLSAETLTRSPHFRTVYHTEQVWIFAVQLEERQP